MELLLSIKNLNVPIISVSDDKDSWRSFNILPGVIGVYYPKKFEKKNNLSKCLVFSDAHQV